MNHTDSSNPNVALDTCQTHARSKRLLLMFGVLALTVSLSGVSTILGKAWMGQWLLKCAWEQAVDTGTPQRPWPWADFLVAGNLRIPELGVQAYVLNSDSGEALAFGPGFSRTTSRDGLRIISGHRDTHFSFMRNLGIGMRIELHSVDRGSPEVFEVYHQMVVDAGNARLPTTIPDTLILLTCFPFDAITANGPLRYLSIARLQMPQKFGAIVL